MLSQDVGGTPQDELEEWAERMTQSTDDEINRAGLRAITTPGGWEDFVSQRIMDERGVNPTEGMLEGLEVGRTNLLARIISQALGR